MGWFFGHGFDSHLLHFFVSLFDSMQTESLVFIPFINIKKLEGHVFSSFFIRSLMQRKYAAEAAHGARGEQGK